MIPITPREAVRKWVEDYASAKNIPVPKVWLKLYAAFESFTNWALRRDAHNHGESPLNWLEMNGRMVELMPFAQKLLYLEDTDDAL